jgi:Putative auto-transporter adhesin, head GIN domain
MKKISGYVALFMILSMAAGCVVDFSDSITGNGNVVTQTRDVREFSGIKVSTGIQVFLTKGDIQSVEVETDENLQEWVRTDVNGGVLDIYCEKTIRMAKTKKVNIVCKRLDNIDISSAGKITGLTNFDAEKLDIEISSGGQLSYETHASEIEISLSSAGRAEIKGSTGKLKADLSSASELKAYDLEAGSCDVSVSSAGVAHVSVKDEASFKASSAGRIHYMGEPKIQEINTSSAGSVNKK